MLGNGLHLLGIMVHSALCCIRHNVAFGVMSFDIMLFCIMSHSVYVVRHNVAFSLMLFGYVSFSVMSFGVRSFGVMSFGIMSVYLQIT